jgi:hypothetical protein
VLLLVAHEDRPPLPLLLLLLAKTSGGAWAALDLTRTKQREFPENRQTPGGFFMTAGE